MPTEREWEQAAQRLIKLTQSQQLQWQADPRIKIRQENIQGDAYCAVVEERRIAVYEYKYQYYDDDLGGWDWRNEVGVEFVGSEGGLEYRWPAIPSRWQLLDAIRCVISGAQDFLKRFLAQPAGKG